MANDGRRWSQWGIDNTPDVNHRFGYIDLSEGLAADRNKTASLGDYFDPRYQISNNGEEQSIAAFNVTRFETVYIGLTDSTGTLPVGSSSIRWKKYYIANESNFNLTIDGNGADPISGSDPFILYPKTTGIFMWTGSIWVVF